MLEVFSFYLILCIETKYLTLHSSPLCPWADMEGDYVKTNCVFPVSSCVSMSLDMSQCSLQWLCPVSGG